MIMKPFLAFAAVLIVTLPFSDAEAGLLTFFKNMFKGEAETEAAVVFNSQTIPLLEAPTNVNPLAGTGGGDITIVQNNALLAATGPLGSIADIEDSAKPNGQISIYIVREGDSLSAIAKMFSVSVNTIVWANDLSRTDLIKTGQTLVILPISGVQYTVVKGDTVQSIAKKFKGDADEIIQYNDLPASGALAAGSAIVIPNGESYVVSTPTSRLRSASGPEYPGYYIRPLVGGRKSQGLHGYNGVDLANSCGTPVLAAASGDVIVGRSYGWNGGYGLYTVIRHPNNTQTLYSHLSSIIVEAGWPVVQGQVIGYVGSTGNSTGCHLHFEV
ncbi:MAG: M23 family metallopeptidase, partial [Candidatus Niyogibacteria bacterium]|nr:M23 family metallopeptidase [Candidatus Niyogibacteria bacterium]